MLFSIQHGEGPRPVILLHGFLGYGRNTFALAQLWARKDPARRFWMPDLPGHGRSPGLPAGAGLTTLARDVLASARASGIAPPFHIVGHSLGGRVALEARRIEPAVERVDFLDIAPGPIPPSLRGTNQVLAILLDAPASALDRGEMRDFFLERGLSRPLTEWLLSNLHLEAGRYTWRFDREALAALHEKTNAADLWPVVEAGGATFRSVRGAHSPYVSDEDAARLEAAGCRVATVEAGHYVHTERTAEVVDRLAAE